MEHARYLRDLEKTKLMNCVEEGEEIQAKGSDSLLNRITAENFPNLEKERVTQVQEAYRTPNHQDQKINTPRDITIKTLSTQNKERILKAAKEKRQVTYKGKPIRITADFSTQTPKARRSWKDRIQALKENNCQPRLVYPAKLSSLIEGETKTFHNKEKLKEFVTTKPALQKILKGLLPIEEETRVIQVDSRKNKPF
jgi:hypothetical protein